MNKQFGLPARLILGTLLIAGFIAPPRAVPQNQDTSTASLADTLAWLANFVPTQTGVFLTSQISNISGCNLTITMSGSGPSGSVTTSVTFSLSDINPASFQVTGGGSPSDPAFDVTMTTRGNAPLVKLTTTDVNHQNTQQKSVAEIGTFPDRGAAQRAANAFQHAANLCANASPF